MSNFPVRGPLPMGDAPLVSNAPIRKGTRVKDANGTVILPLVVRANTETAENHFKMSYPLFIREDGMSYDPSIGEEQALTSTEAQKDYVFYGIVVGFGKKRKRRTTSNWSTRLSNRIDVCLRGVYEAPQAWLMTPTDTDFNTFKHFVPNGGFVVYDKDLQIPYCVTEQEVVTIATNPEDKAMERWVILGQFFQKVTDWKAVEKGATLTLQAYTNSVQGMDVLRVGRTQRQKRMDRRRFRVFLRC